MGPASPLPFLSSHHPPPPPLSLLLLPPALFQVVRVQASASSPVLLCSEPGHDASKQVDDLAEALQRPMASVAMGSEEGYVPWSICCIHTNVGHMRTYGHTAGGAAEADGIGGHGLRGGVSTT